MEFLNHKNKGGNEPAEPPKQKNHSLSSFLFLTRHLSALTALHTPSLLRRRSGQTGPQVMPTRCRWSTPRVAGRESATGKGESPLARPNTPRNSGMQVRIQASLPL